MNDLDSRFLCADPMRRVSVHNLAEESLAAQVQETLQAPQQPGTRALDVASTRTPVARRLRWTLAAAAAVLIPVGGLGVAGAAGALPQPFLDALSHQQSYGTDPSTASLAGSLPGPSGQRFEAWTTTGHGGAICISTWFVPATSAVGKAPAALDGGAGVCTPGPVTDIDPLTSGGTSGGDGKYVYTFLAGAAAETAELEFADGTSTPAVVTAGQIVGWFPAEPTSPPPTLTAYTATGGVLASTTVPIPICLGDQTD